ncbi:MAG: ABC transporter ATP-binding protein [Actinobacteria bacterium]|nr:ABC transporter ATP-binding protein [Actinomycetota bacterium]
MMMNSNDPSNSSHDVAVSVRGLVVDYGKLRAVDNISFEARSGEVTVVIGPNGAGKTSTIEVCAGVRRGTSGTVRVLGFDPQADRRRLNTQMSVMLQDGGVYPGARVMEVTRHYCNLYGNKTDATELLASVDLMARQKSSWRRLSGGEKQRLSLALALAAKPKVAFLDEPTSGVDIFGRDLIRTVVRRLAAEGCAVILATHELDEAQRVADHVLMFHRGTLLADAPLSELRARPSGNQNLEDIFRSMIENSSKEPRR